MNIYDYSLTIWPIAMFLVFFGFILIGISLALMSDYADDGRIDGYDFGDSLTIDRMFVGGFIILFISIFFLTVSGI